MISAKPIAIVAMLTLAMTACSPPMCPPVRTVGESAIIDPALGGDCLVLLRKEDYEACKPTSGTIINVPRILFDEERTFWAEPGAAVEVIDISHAMLTRVTFLEGEHDGRSGWVRLENVTCDKTDR